MEFLEEFVLPLFRQVGWAEDRETLDFLAVQQFFDNHQGFDGFADTNVVSNEQSDWILTQGHEQWDKLIGSGLDSDVAE